MLSEAAPTQLDALIVAPHPDDAELGAGGSILRMLAQGLRVGILDLTDGEPTPHGSLEVRARETAAANEVLGNPWRENLGLPNRTLQATLAARNRLAAVFRRVRPRWIFAPYWEDAHPDHVAATQLIQDARFSAKLTKTDIPGAPYHPERIYYYYCVHLKLAPQPAFVLDISDLWETKRRAIECYQSQFVEGRNNSPSFLEQLHHEAAYWGKTIGRAYGEPIATREPLGLTSLTCLV